ncbi:MAG: T9SS type B sorting domain-containing protein [Nonlabens sp.]|uniref:T9SS type B sorting domain-containing protein n=1 Tax=Nonlabens sp. TaxID=1888209 RepID=UPI003EF48C9D
MIFCIFVKADEKAKKAKPKTMKNLITAAFLFIGLLSYGQGIINMPNNNGVPTRFVTCSGSFNDDGQNGNYSNNMNGYAVLCPGIQTDRMQLNFIQMIIQTGDVLTIYDGDSTAAPQLGTFTNTTTAPGLFQASAGNPTGCLTVTFTSNGSGNDAGWRAGISCFDPCQAISTAIVTTPAPDPDGIVRICQGDTVNFDGSATFSVDGTGATYEWDLGNGNGLNPGAIQSETYVTSGIYLIDFVVTDATGCSDRESRDVVVHVSTDPDFTGTAAVDNTICFGESTDLNGNVTPVEFAITPSPPITGRTFLPDDNGTTSYQTCVTVDLFPPGATMTNATDLVDIFLNMEHSYLGDLDLTVTAPNGATVALHVFSSGGGTYLGVPIDVDTNLNPGTGFDYVFTETATQTWAQAQAGVTTMPAGDYLPVDPYSTFVGSPLNGQWCINITDNLSSDNGYIFYWGLNFNPAIIPADLSFTPMATSEQWLPDPTITNVNGATITVTPTTAGTNCYTYEYIDNFGCPYTEVVCINVLPEILNGVPTDFVICDPTGSAATVDLTTRNIEILNGLAAADFPISYHLTQADAENLTNAIGTPTAFTNTSNPQTIYAAITDITTMCVVVESFDITVGSATFNAVPNIDLCDDPSNDGFETFDLTSQDAGALGSQSASGFTVTYYTSQANATAGISSIPNPATYVNVQTPSETIYARIESVTDATCFDTGSFDITVSPTPVANVPMDMIACDDVSNDGLATFILSSRTGMVLGTQSQTDFNVTYHNSQADADADTGALTSSGYINAGTGPETIFVRIESVLNATCFNTTSFTIQVDPQAVFNSAVDLVLCDDITNDGFEIFDLTSNEVDILGAQNAANFTITYHNTQMDADMYSASIPNPSTYTNVVSPVETIYVRVSPNGNMNCYATGTFDIIVDPTPIANAVGDLTLCDDPSNDGTESFDLAAQTAAILGAQNAADVSITFHPSQADADGNTAALALNFDNTSSPQTIYVRAENVNNTDCYTTTTFDLILNPAPTVTAASNMEQCDDPSGDGVETFDLTQNEAAILNGQAPADFIFSYHLDQTAADAGTPSIATSYDNTSSPETIYVRVENITTGCYNTTTFDLILSDIPAIAVVPNLEECDEDGDTVAVFALSDRESDITNGLTGVAVQYYASNMDALNDTGALDENTYSNTANPQTISYRLINTTTGCFAIGSFLIEAVPAPVVVMPMDVNNCDDGSGNAIADLGAVTPQVIGTQTGLTVSYHESQNNADSDTNAVSSNYSYNSNTTLFVRVEDDNTDCVSFTTVNLILDPLPQPALLSQYVLCIDPNGVLLNGPEVLDTGLSTASYTFEWFLNGATIAGSTGASHDATEPGDYEVLVTNITTGCDITDSTNVRQSGIPTDYSVDVTTSTYAVDHQVVATASGPDEYWFRLDDGPYVNNGIFNNVTPGLHSVTIAERSGCGEIIVEVFVFGYPDYFTPNNDGFHDTWNIIGADRLPFTRLYIFDRYGKLLKQLETTGPGWDGTYNGQPLPSSDYWFKIEYEQDGRMGEATGHFAIKR